MNPEDNDLAKQVADLIAWKESIEKSRAERFTGIRNEISSILSRNQCTMEEAMTVISLVQADLNASFVNKQRAPQ